MQVMKCYASFHILSPMVIGSVEKGGKGRTLTCFNSIEEVFPFLLISDVCVDEETVHL